MKINNFPDKEKYQMTPWHAAAPLHVAGASPVKALVISNMVYLDKVPQGRVHVAAAAPQQTVAGVLQTLLRRIVPHEEATATGGIAARYAVASTAPTPDGKAVLHIPGVGSVRDIAYIAFAEAGKPLLWRRVTE